MDKVKPADVDTYIAAFPDDVREILESVRRTIRAAEPEATEAMSYGIAAYRLDGHPLVYFGGWKTYVSVYPLPEPPTLQSEIAPYRHGPGTVRFPFGEPIPHDLIARLVKARSAERRAKG